MELKDHMLGLKERFQFLDPDSQTGSAHKTMAA
jgi:hypothetical protein